MAYNNSGNSLSVLEYLNRNFIERLEEAKRVEDVNLSFYNIYIWIVFAIGFPANIIIMITIGAMKVMSPATVFISVLAFCDCMALVSKLIGHQLTANGVDQGTVLCKFEFVPSYFSTVANWVLVLICVERFISVCYPLQKAYLVTKRRCFITAGVMGIVFLAFFALIFGIMRNSSEEHLCGTEPWYLTFWLNWWPWISISLYLFIPFVLIIALTIPIIRGMFVSRRHRRSLVQKHSETGTYSATDKRLLQETERTERMITIMLIVAAIVFLVLCLPACVFHLTYRKKSDELDAARQRLFKQVAYLITDISHAVNFFLYFFTAQKFRSVAFQILCPKCCKQKLCGNTPAVSPRGEYENNSVASRATISTKLAFHVEQPV